MNLTDQQKDLLRAIVSGHESNGGQEFIFISAGDGGQLIYPYGAFVPVATSGDADFVELKNSKLITTYRNSEGRICGQPTQLGIATVGQDFASPKPGLIEAFLADIRVESKSQRPPRTLGIRYDRCPFVGADTIEQLKECAARYENRIWDQIESLRRHRRELQHITGAREQEAAESALRQEASALRQKMVVTAEAAVEELVRGFADGLNKFQGTLARDRDSVRQYTACLAGEIRELLSGLDPFEIEPLLPWRLDSITQKAIHTCEEVLIEARLSENGPRHKQKKDVNNPESIPTWSPLVQEWEALKSQKKIFKVRRERMAESDLRTIISRAYGGKPDDFTWEDLKSRALELCRHYESIQIVPASDGLAPRDERSEEAVPEAGAEFWKEREEEFRSFNTPEHAAFLAEYDPENGWAFRDGPRAYGSAPEAVRVFQSLAGMAAKGLRSSYGFNTWEDWLKALLRAKNRSNGNFLYSQASTGGSRWIGETYLTHMARDGKPIPDGGIVVFSLIDNASADDSEKSGVTSDFASVGTALYWDSTSERIECLFKASADYCLELRSLVLGSSLAPEKRREGRPEPVGSSSTGSWKVLQSAFLEFADEYTELSGEWRAEFGEWRLWPTEKLPKDSDEMLEAHDLFKRIAWKAADKLKLSSDTNDPGSWQLWLTYLKDKKSPSYRPRGSPQAVTEREWEALQQSGKSLVAIRRENGYTTGDEFKGLDPTHWIQDGQIKGVFKASAKFCFRLFLDEFGLGIDGVNGALSEAPADKPPAASAPPLDGSPHRPEELNPPALATGEPNAGGRVPTVGDIQAALDSDSRKNAVKLRCEMDKSNVKEFWIGAFQSGAWAVETKRTAFNRWQGSRKKTPKWADPLIRAHLLR